jgi:acyl-CoA synthetase (AMP-forming)/AMP-acid ligase II
MIKLLMGCDNAGGDVSGLKTICYGGGPMYLSDCKEALQIFGPKLYQLYGQGEAPMTISNLTKKMHASSDCKNYEQILSSVGIARTGVEIAIFSPEGTELPPESIGEIVTRSACVMSGYLNDKTATSEAIKNGWLHTGDIGSIDKSGVLTLKDRSKDMIISGGMNIYPREVEDLLISLEKVTEVAVVGTKNEKWGEEVVAFVVGRATQREMDNHCLNHLARFKRPKRYIFLDSLPKNNYGKVLKKNLRDQLLRRTFD